MLFCRVHHGRPTATVHTGDREVIQATRVVGCLVKGTLSPATREHLPLEVQGQDLHTLQQKVLLALLTVHRKDQDLHTVQKDLDPVTVQKDTDPLTVQMVPDPRTLRSVWVLSLFIWSAFGFV